LAYTIPTAADLKALYPAFADVADATVDAWIAKASTEAVDTSWQEIDYAPAIIDYAAHRMALLGLGVQSEVEGYARAGLTGIRSGSFSANFSDKKVSKASGGSLDATAYGQSYKLLLRRNKGGPRVVPGAAPIDDGWGPTGRLVNGAHLPWGS
jgi:hypothetical protein